MPSNALFEMAYKNGMHPIEFDNRTATQKLSNALMRLYSMSAEGNQDYIGARVGASLPIGRGLSVMAGSNYGMAPESQFRPQLEGRDIGVSYSGRGLNIGASRSVDDVTKEALYRLMLSKSF